MILAGWRMEEIAENLAAAGLEISIEEFIQAAYGRGYTFSEMDQIPVGSSLEGFFPPGSYQIELEAPHLQIN